MKLKSIRHPELYHGRIGKSYFKGWYFKLIDAAIEPSFAFIPGIFLMLTPQPTTLSSRLSTAQKNLSLLALSAPDFYLGEKLPFF